MSVSAVRTARSWRTWVTRLDELGIEHGGIVDAHYGSGLSFRDPDGIALEFFAPPRGIAGRGMCGHFRLIAGSGAA